MLRSGPTRPPPTGHKATFRPDYFKRREWLLNPEIVAATPRGTALNRTASHQVSTSFFACTSFRSKKICGGRIRTGRRFTSVTRSDRVMASSTLLARMPAADTRMAAPFPRLLYGPMSSRAIHNAKRCPQPPLSQNRRPHSRRDTAGSFPDNKACSPGANKDDAPSPSRLYQPVDLI